MKIEVLYVSNCPNHAVALGRLREILSAESFKKIVSEVLVRDAEMAQSLKFPGSPTIRINGQDVEPQSGKETAFGLMCRLYRTAAVLRPRSDFALQLKRRVKPSPDQRRNRRSGSRY